MFSLWLSIIPYVISAGANLVRGQLAKLVILWRNSFPHSVKDATVEQAKGNSQSWVVTLEGRAGSLSCKYLCNYITATIVEPFVGNNIIV